MRVIPVNAVKGEAYLGSDLYNDGGNILLKKGVLLTPSLLQKIYENGIYTIYIQDEYSTSEIKDIIRPELRRKAVSSIMDAFKQIDKDNKKTLEGTTNLKKNLQIKQMSHYLESLKGIGQTIIEDLTSNTNLLINMVDIKNIDTYTYEHSVSVAVLSLVIGIDLRFSKSELQALFMGALLHDVGKTFLPTEILNKKEPLNEAELELVKQHPVLGYRYLKENFNFPLQISNVILNHHERINGGGYPKGLLGDNIDRYSKIVAIADKFDELTSNSLNGKAVTPNEAIEYLMGSSGSQFEYDFTLAFTKRVVPYPEGSLVKMTGGLIGVVLESNPGFPLRPVIKVIHVGKYHDRPEFKVDTEIDLLKENRLVIEDIQYEDPNAQ